MMPLENGMTAVKKDRQVAVVDCSHCFSGLHGGFF